MFHRRVLVTKAVSTKHIHPSHACHVCYNILASKHNNVRNFSTTCCSVFFVGYTVTNVCGGYLAARYTAKMVLGLGLLICSVFTILMPVAASSKSVFVVLACACLMGAGEGVMFPAIQHLQGKWLPPNRRTFANTLLFAGMRCFGGVLCCKVLDMGNSLVRQMSGNVQLGVYTCFPVCHVLLRYRTA